MALSAMMQQYLDIKEQNKDSLLFFIFNFKEFVVHPHAPPALIDKSYLL